MKLFYVLSILIGISMFSVVLILLPVHLSLFLLLKPVNAKLYRKLNYKLIYFSWYELISIAEHVSQFKVRMYFKDQESLDHFGKERVLCICNHPFELDWLLVALAMEKFKFAAGLRSFSKSVVKFFPIIGWWLWFNEYAFIHRDFKRDEKILSKSIDNFVNDPNPLLILMFCEGTRITPEKYAASIEFAKSRGVDHFKHHLIPRPSGFTHCVSYMKKDPSKRIASIYNVQVAVCESLEGQNAPTFHSLLGGLSVTGDVYLERIDIDSIEAEAGDHKSLQSYLNGLYHQKDQLVDYHRENKEFPGIKKVINPRTFPLIITIFCSTAIHTFYAYLIVSSIIHGHIWTLLSVVTFIATVAFSFIHVIRGSSIEKASNYGTKKLN